MPARSKETLPFRLIIISSVIFSVNVLAMLAAAFSPPESPLTQLFGPNALLVLGGEVTAILVFVVMAMIFDRPTNSSAPEDPKTESNSNEQS